MKYFHLITFLASFSLSYAQTEIRVNSGGSAVTHAGNIFSADMNFSGSTGTSNYNKPIPEIYKTERYGNARILNYNFSVPNGQYLITLHFMESYFGTLQTGGVGSRIFDVSIENEKVLDDYDIFAEVGADIPSVKVYSILVADGSLDLYLSSLAIDGGVDFPKICAIEIVENPEPNENGTQLWSENEDDIYYNTGNVGIGTNSPGSYKLAVNGNIRAKEIKVETTNWPDYVFTDGYKILSLKEIESYIQLNGHLPNIPSAQEIEMSGVDLGEMNRLLLEKIEELTLYAIQQERELKTVQELKNDIIRNEREIKQLKAIVKKFLRTKP